MTQNDTDLIVTGIYYYSTFDGDMMLGSQASVTGSICLDHGLNAASIHADLCPRCRRSHHHHHGIPGVGSFAPDKFWNTPFYL
jgi:hypothetical protein